jgi:hypothetical protein
MTGLTVDGARCEALFASGLQRSDAPAAESVTEAISRTVRRVGNTDGCSRSSRTASSRRSRPPHAGPARARVLCGDAR